MIADLADRYGVRASKSLGQNFLINTNLVHKIASQFSEDKNVLEIGPGIGSLTVALARQCDSVTAVEFDIHVLAPLQDVLTQAGVQDKVEVIHDDAMKVDLSSLCEQHGISTLAGNLPYNIAATLIMNIVRGVPRITRMVVMVQKEVADRLAAPLATREVSAVSYKVQSLMDVRTLFHVSPGSFVPAPRVDSTVIELVRKESMGIDIPEEQIDDFFSMIDAAFSQRRKMLRSSLSTFFDNDERPFLDSGVDSSLRPEQCRLEDFAALYRSFKEYV